MHPTTLRSTTAASLMNDGQAARSSACHTGVAVCIHGHFYQPPRENPYLGAIERQPGAAPFHDWNERIHLSAIGPMPLRGSSTIAAK
jgi:hypothetical protein